MRAGMFLLFCRGGGRWRILEGAQDILAEEALHVINAHEEFDIAAAGHVEALAAGGELPLLGQ